MPFNIQWIDSATGAEDVLSLDTPAGQLMLAVREDVIIAVDWASGRNARSPHEHPIQQQLARYWVNPEFSTPIKLLRQGSTYRHQVWAALSAIPLGETVSYSAVAKTIASSARAVGNACRDNPYPLFIPCHRVVSVSGMGGYCGQTNGYLMGIKRNLLAFEAAFKK
ncbi:MAG: methylated-DNA--[protein]-cysteine S-methyltransferase [Methylovulum sp.]|nr:methylated-DNA--[protein]-cysteine S-methyltransferase [Methylovulum sp.]